MPERSDMAGCFSNLTQSKKDLLKSVTANWHYRDGVLHEDGSMGTVKISHLQLLDTLAWVLLNAKQG